MHSKLRLRSGNQRRLGDVIFVARSFFSPGLLPSVKEVLEVMLFHLLHRKGVQSMSTVDAASLVAMGLSDHWVRQNVYTINYRNIAPKIVKLYGEFMALVRTPMARRNDNWDTNKLNPFLMKARQCLNIACTDPIILRKQEKFYGVKMSEVERDFLEDQLTNREMFCTTDIDKDWAKTFSRNRKDAEGLDKMRNNEDVAIRNQISVPYTDENDNHDEDTNLSDDDYEIEDEKNNEPSNGAKKKKRKFDSNFSSTELPEGWMHIRKSHHSVRPEYYQCIDRLVSQYHCTYSQGEAAVVVVGKTMFGRPWKFFDEDKDVITLDTVPHHKNQIIHSRAAEAFTIDKIVRSIVESDEMSSITYHDDGSKTQVKYFQKKWEFFNIT